MTTVRFLALALGAALLSACGSPGSGTPALPLAVPAAPKAAPEASAEAPKPPAEAPTLAALPDAVARLEKLRESVERILVPDESERKAVEELEAARVNLAKMLAAVRKLPVDSVREIRRQVATSDGWVAERGEIVTRRFQQVERRLARVAELKKTLSELAGLAEAGDAPAGMRKRIADSLALLDDLEVRLRARRAEVLVSVDKLAEVRGAVAASLAASDSALEEARERAARAEREPVWRLKFAGWKSLDGARARLTRDVTRAWFFVRDDAPFAPWAPVVGLAATALLVLALRRRGTAGEPSPAGDASRRIRRVAWVAAVPVTVALLVVSSPPGPPAFYSLALLPTAPAAAWIVTRLVGPGIGRTVWVLALALAVLPLRGALELFPLVGRLVFLLQTVPVAACLLLDFRGDAWKERFPSRRFADALQRVAILLAALLGLAAVLVAWGRLPLGELLGFGALETLAGMVVTGATYLVLAETFRASVSSGIARRLLVARDHADELLAFGIRALRLLALAAVLLVGLGSFDLLFPFLDLVRRLFRTSVALGAMSISTGGLAMAAVVLSVTFLVARVVGFVLSRELLPRFTLARGMAFAIATTTRYVLLCAGFFLAAGAAGVDLAKVGFLAGALGVGLGIGLQNIVGNFLSGLILLFERPIQVGDTVDVSGTVGSVTSIGIRASTIRSGDGAEVVVPNGDLIAKPLVNWTLSDPHRRFDVVVGVAYGSPLEATAQALLAAAAKAPGVLGGPAPEAFLQSFGASSLDWTLRVWVESMDAAPRSLSALKRAVSEELDRAGIEVPFPQQDLRIRSVSPEARDALAAAVAPRRAPPAA